MFSWYLSHPPHPAIKNNCPSPIKGAVQNFIESRLLGIFLNYRLRGATQIFFRKPEENWGREAKHSQQFAQQMNGREGQNCPGPQHNAYVPLSEFQPPRNLFKLDLCF